MANLSPLVLILIVVVCAGIALAVGYFLGSRFGGKKSVAMKEATEKHDSYKNDVREHFEQTSAIMSRMVDDYRDMYKHMADGAEKLAEMHPEKLVTPPPAPEAITRDTPVDQSATKTQAAQSKQGGDRSANNTAEAKPAAAPQKPAGTNPQSSTQAKTSDPAGSQSSAKAAASAQGKNQSDTAATAAKADPKASASAAGAEKAGSATTPGAKADTDPKVKPDAKADTNTGDAANRDAVMNSDSSNDRPWNKESKNKDGKRYGLE